MAGDGGMDDIEQLLAEFEASDLRELHVRRGDFEIYLSKDADAAGMGGARVATARAGSPDTEAHRPAPAPVATAVDESAWPDGAIAVRAPYLGTFYRSPKPGAPSYVEVGDSVAEGDDLCLVEVMKLFTAVRAESAGRIEAVLAEDGAMVAADQPLFLVVPG